MPKYVIKKKIEANNPVTVWHISDVFNNKKPKSFLNSVKKLMRINDKTESVFVSWRMSDDVIIPAFRVNSKGIVKHTGNRHNTFIISNYDSNHVAQYTIDPFSGCPKFTDINAITYAEFYSVLLSGCYMTDAPYFVVNMMQGTWPPKIAENLKVIDAKWDNLGFHLIIG